MNDYTFGHLSNDVAWNSYIAAESHEIAGTAKTLALLAEVDERKLYLPAGYASMCDYCMRARRMTKDRALKRIRVARAGREFPAIFRAIAEGRLGLTAVLLLVPQLTSETAEELLALANRKSNEEIDQLLAARFRQPVPQLTLEPTEQGDAAEQVAARPPVPCSALNEAVSMGPVPPAPAAKHSGWRYSYTAARDEKLQHVRSLLAHSRPGASVEQLLDLALDSLKDKLEKQKFGKCDRPGKAMARNAATRCKGMVGEPLERRVFVGCQGLGPRGTRRALPVSSSSA